MITDLKIVYPINKVFAVGDLLKLDVEYSPKTETVNLSFSVDPAGVITVDPQGKITGVAVGQTRVIVTDSISGLTDVANVAVISEEDAYPYVLAKINEGMTKGFVFRMNDIYGLPNYGVGAGVGIL